MTRRDFLGAAAVAPFALRPQQKNCIFLLLTGGPSQVDTWDPKPASPFRAIRTNVPGIEISEIFPRMARHADKYTLVRSVYSDAPPDHESGMRLIDEVTAGFAKLDQPLSYGRGSADGNRFQGRDRKRAVSSFEDNCVRARELVESGVSHVRVNMFDTVFNRTTWDSHGYGPFSTIGDYRTVGAIFDAAYSTLLEDLHQRGLLESTLVVAMGEFGRSPRINPQGGRDHWTRCQTVVLAGGGIRGAEIYGSSDIHGAEPKDRPVAVREILETARTGFSPVRDLLT